MPFYEDRGKKPHRKDSIGPEEGYRAHGKGRKRPEDWQNKPGDRRDAGGQYGKRPDRSGLQTQRQDRNGFDPKRPDMNRFDGKRPYESGKGEQSGQKARPGKAYPHQNTYARATGRVDERSVGGRYRGNEIVRPTPPPTPSRPTPPRPPARAIAPVEPPFVAPYEGDEPLPRENMLSGRNPIREAIKSGRDMEKLLVAKGELSGSAREIVAMAREAHIVVQVVDRARLDEMTQHHQGMIAFASAFRYATVEDILQKAKEKGEDPLLVVLDGITDPHNLGAIIRSAECAGAHGVVIPERRAVGLTPAAVKASAGAVEYLPVARVGNLSRFMETLKAQGIWITAADMAGEPYAKADLTGPLALVIGAEGGGVSRLVLSGCDRRVALPICGKIDSLNASVAAGVLLYEIRRQRG